MDFDVNLDLPDNQKNNKTIDLDTNTIYDVLILGGGPAGLTAAVYCMRKGVKTGMLIDIIGGQVIKTSSIENYMGYKYIEGNDLIKRFKEQVKQFEIGLRKEDPAVNIKPSNIIEIESKSGKIFKARSVIVATGKSPRWLDIPGEQELLGKGVAVCATCDAPFFQDKNVTVVGGGNSGVEAALDLVDIANHVTIIQDVDELTADQILIDKLNQYDNYDVIYGHTVTEVLGDDFIEGIKIKDYDTKEVERRETEGLFVEIGWVPNSGFVEGTLELNKWNEIKVDCACHTNQPGIFAAGDVTSVPYKQIIIAGGEGSKAALSACEYVMRN